MSKHCAAVYNTRRLGFITLESYSAGNVFLFFFQSSSQTVGLHICDKPMVCSSRWYYTALEPCCITVCFFCAEIILVWIWCANYLEKYSLSWSYPICRLRIHIFSHTMHAKGAHLHVENYHANMRHHKIINLWSNTYSQHFLLLLFSLLTDCAGMFWIEVHKCLKLEFFLMACKEQKKVW